MEGSSEEPEPDTHRLRPDVRIACTGITAWAAHLMPGVIRERYAVGLSSWVGSVLAEDRAVETWMSLKDELNPIMTSCVPALPYRNGGGRTPDMDSAGTSAGHKRSRGSDT